LVVVILLLIAKLVPVRRIPEAPFVSTAPLNVVVPLPALWTIEEALIAFAVTFVALEIVRVVKRLLPPTAPVKVILPVPATNVSAVAPSSVLEKLIFALLDVIVLVPVRLTGLGKLKGLAPVTVILFPI
jgi:hypothetical protein